MLTFLPRGFRLFSVLNMPKKTQKRIAAQPASKVAGSDVSYVLSRTKAPVYLPKGMKPKSENADLWLAGIRDYFVEQGRKGGLKGGQATSTAKKKSSRENGKLGGRPKGSKNRRRISL